MAFEISDSDGNLRGWEGGFSYNSGSDITIKVSKDAQEKRVVVLSN